MLSPNLDVDLLRFMQVELYEPRLQLPFAPVMPIAPLINNEQAISKIRKISNAKAANDAKAILKAPKSKIEPKTAQDTPSLVDLSFKINLEPAPTFNMQLVRSGSCLILLDLPDKRPLFTQPKLHNLLQGILRAAKLEADYQAIGAPLFWPLFKSKIISQDFAAACEYIENLIGHQSKMQTYVCLWLMGAQAQKYAVNLERTWNVPSLLELSNDIEAKRNLWQQMQQKMALWQNPSAA